MLTYDLIVLGFGKAGKTLAAKMANLGKKVALVERSKKMYGGTCINIGCIPTKSLVVAAEKKMNFEEAMAYKNSVVGKLNPKNYNGLIQNSVDVIDAEAYFIENKVIEVKVGEDKKQLTAETIIINTGAVSNHLPIKGLLESKNVFDSTGIQNIEKLPAKLGILGGGNIGLEFAEIYRQLGSKVIVLDASSSFMPRQDEVVSQLVHQYMTEDGITLIQNVKTTEIKNEGEKVVVVTEGETYEFDALLYAVGRKPNVEPLHLENTDIELTPRGAIQVDKHCQTNVKGVFAVGDVNGGPQFTYISLDDFRIVYDYLTGEGKYTLETRKNIPSTIFINPPLSQIGLTEKEAKEKNLPYQTKELFVSNMPRAHVNGNLRGVFKVTINKETKEILGATIFSKGAEEIINLITIAMDNKIPYTYFKNQIFTHPTLSENLNDVFAF